MVPSPRKHHHCSPNNRISSPYLTFLNTGPSYHQTLLTTFDVQADMTCKEVIWLCSNNSAENRKRQYRYLPCYVWKMTKSIIGECHSILLSQTVAIFHVRLPGCVLKKSRIGLMNSYFCGCCVQCN